MCRFLCQVCTLNRSVEPPIANYTGVAAKNTTQDMHYRLVPHKNQRPPVPHTTVWKYQLSITGSVKLKQCTVRNCEHLLSYTTAQSEAHRCCIPHNRSFPQAIQNHQLLKWLLHITQTLQSLITQDAKSFLSVTDNRPHASVLCRVHGSSVIKYSCSHLLFRQVCIIHIMLVRTVTIHVANAAATQVCINQKVPSKPKHTVLT